MDKKELSLGTVENRVKEIRNLSRIDSWRHVPGDQNPADLPSRGCDVRTLIDSNWWEGPNWLKKQSSAWPTSDVAYLKDEIEGELRKTAKLRIPILESEAISNVSAINFNVKPESFYVPNVTKFNTMVNAFAWLNRFIKHARWPTRKKCKGILLVEERREAEKIILRISQIDSFAGLEDANLSAMNATLDDDKLMHVRSKIIHWKDIYSFQYPLVLLGENPITRLLISDTHKNLGHCNVITLLSHLREEYWIIHGRKAVRSVVKKCVICTRHRELDL